MHAMGSVTSRRPTATDRATPVERSGRFPCGTGHGSLCSSPSKSVKFMSTLCTGCRNLGRTRKQKTGLRKEEQTAAGSLCVTEGCRPVQFMDVKPSPAGWCSLLGGQRAALLSRRRWLRQTQHFLEHTQKTNKLNFQIDLARQRC